MGDLGSILGLGRSPGEGNGYPLQHSDLENSLLVHSFYFNFDPYFLFKKKSNSENIKDLHIIPKIVEGITGKNIFNLKLGKDFLDMTLKS